MKAALDKFELLEDWESVDSSDLANYETHRLSFNYILYCFTSSCVNDESAPGIFQAAQLCHEDSSEKFYLSLTDIKVFPRFHEV